MFKKFLKLIALISVITSSGIGGWLLGTKLADITMRRMKPRISQINVWHGPVPTHPSQL